MCKRIEFNNSGWNSNGSRDSLYIKFVYDMFASSRGEFRRPKVDKYMRSSDSEEFIEFEFSQEKYLEQKLFQDLKKTENKNED